MILATADFFEGAGFSRFLDFVLGPPRSNYFSRGGGRALSSTFLGAVAVIRDFVCGVLLYWAGGWTH